MGRGRSVAHIAFLFARLQEIPGTVGMGGEVIDQWLGVFVPAGTPPAIGAQLNTLINKSLNDAIIRKSFLQSAQEPVGGSAEEFSRLVHADFEKYGRLMRDLNMKAN